MQCNKSSSGTTPAAAFSFKSRSATASLLAAGRAAKLLRTTPAAVATAFAVDDADAALRGVEDGDAARDAAGDAAGLPLLLATFAEPAISGGERQVTRVLPSWLG